MGFSTLVAQVVLFGVMITIFITYTITMGAYIYKTDNSLYSSYETLELKLNTEMTAINATYSASKKDITTYIKNTGKTKIDTEYLDIYLDSERIARNDTSLSITIQSSTEIKNPGIWDPKETIQIIIDKRIDETGTHYMEFFTAQAVTDIVTFIR